MVQSPASLEDIYSSVRLPLGQNTCIRVIKIRPSTMFDHSDPIACDFSILDFDAGVLIHDENTLQQLTFDASTHLEGEGTKRVEYQAVSYTWGEPSANHFIELDGTRFHVRRNLWDFLYRARVDDLTRYLWIDAICINQTTVTEKNQQVGIMGEIYHRAECVIVWLGDSTAGERESLEIFLADLRESEKHKPRALSVHHDTAVTDFLWLPHWSRAWIVQEYYVARRKDVWYGELRLTQEDMEDMNEYSFWVGSLTFTSPAYNLWKIEIYLTESRAERNARSAFYTFFGLSKMFQGRECADSRDQIFSLLSLLTPKERKEIDIRPDYSKSPTSLFLDTVTHVANKAKSSRPLAFFVILDSMLSPNVHNPSLQLAILNLRELDIWNGSKTAGSDEHPCDRPIGPQPVIDINGCIYCHQRPVVTFDRGRNWKAEQTIFSLKEWQAYVQALLASENQEDRQLGARYCRDKALDLNIDGSSTRHPST